MDCHMVANEKLVNNGGHGTGSDFKLSKRTQGKIRHYPKASVDELRFNNLVGDAVELEVGLRALAIANSSGKYSAEMLKRTQAALSKLSTSAANDTSGYAKKSVSLAKSTTIKAGNKSLITVADNIAVNTMKMVQKKNGYPYPANKLKAGKTISKSAAPRPIAKTAKPPVKKVQPAPAKQPAYSKPAAIAPKYQQPVAAKPVQTKTLPIPIAASPQQNLASTESGNLIKHYQVVTPSRKALCKTFTPWVLGNKKVVNNTSLAKDTCIGFEIEVTKNADVYIFIEYVNGAAKLLMPNQCNIANMSNNSIIANKKMLIPKDKNRAASVLQISSVPNLYRIHTVAVESQTEAKQAIAQLALSVDSICEKSAKTDNLRSKLEAIIAKHKAHIAWETTTIDPG